MDLRQHWATIEKRLRAARNALPITAARLACFEEYLVQNELELALDELEALAAETSDRQGFWSEMLWAAEAMELHDHAARYRLRLDGPGSANKD